MSGQASQNETGSPIFSDGTPQVLVELARNPLADIGCIFPHAESAMCIWYMHAGCLALSETADLQRNRLKDFRVQPLCLHHNERQEPLYPTDDQAPDAVLSVTSTVSPHFLGGAHLLVDRTVRPDSDFPQVPWSEAGPHWSDSAGLDGGMLQPALELGFGMNTLRRFANTELGRLVFANYPYLLWK